MRVVRDRTAEGACTDTTAHLLEVTADLIQHDTTHGTRLTAAYLRQLWIARRSILTRLVSALVREGMLDVEVAEKRGLSLPLRQASGTGRLRLAGPVSMLEAGGQSRVLADPVELLDALDKIGMAVGQPAAWQRLRQDVKDSVAGHALALGAAGQRAERLRSTAATDHDRPFAAVVAALKGSGYDDSLLAAFEQWVVDGHPLQPVAKIKSGMSATDVLRYCPEFGATFDLRLVAVARHAASGADGRGGYVVADVDAAAEVLRRAFPATVAAAEAELAAGGRDPGRHVLIPVHPHQLLSALPALHADALAAGTIVPLTASVPARPLMSVRTLAVREAGAKTGLHVKTALEVQLTGAVRGVSPEAAHNGPRVSVLLAKIASIDLDVAKAAPDGRSAFAVCRELAGISYVPPEARTPAEAAESTTEARTPAEAANSTETLARKRSLGAVLREDAENLVAEGEVAMPIAALLANSPLTGRTLGADLLTDLHTAATAGARAGAAGQDDSRGMPPLARADVAQDWLRQHVELCVPPILTLLVRYGIALEPHPQNTVVVLKNAWPHRILVRDLGGVRVFESRLVRRGLSVELVPGSALRCTDADALRAKVYFPLFSNHLGELVAVLAEGAGCREDRLWSVVRTCVQQTFRRLSASACCAAEAADAASDAVALMNKPWPLKTMLAMRLAGLVTDQRYVDAPNPLAEVGAPAEAAISTAEARTLAEAAISTAGLTEPEHRMFAELRSCDPELALRWLRELPAARLSTAHHALSALLRENGPGIAGRVTTMKLPLPPCERATRLSQHVARELGQALNGGTGRLVRIRLESEHAITAVCADDAAFGLDQVLGPVLLDDGKQVTAVTRAEQLLDALSEHTAGTGVDWTLLRAELDDSARNLALSRASVGRRGEQIRRRAGVLPATDLLTTLVAGRSPTDVTLDFDGLCAEGHNVHPCAKVRTGFSAADSLAYTAECGSTVGVELVAVRRDLVLSTPDCSGRSVGDLIAEHYPGVIIQAHEGLRRRGHRAQDYELVPVHPWQARTALPREYPGELASGAVVHIPEAQLACRPTVSVRSLVTAAPGRHGRRLTVKTALDVLLTSTRRTISPATTRNGPRLSALLGQLVAKEACAGRVECVPELAGVAFAPGEGTTATPSRQRGLSALLRADPSDHLLPGETAFTGCALRIVSPMSGRSLLIELVDVMAAQACTSRAEAAMTFLTGYADLILSVTLPLMWRYGIALEGHLQNTLLVVRDHRPVRLLLRDFAGVRLHQGRMRAAGLDFTPHPSSVSVTEDLDEVRAKLAYAVVQANLANVVGQLTTACRLPAAALWEVVRGAICATFERLEPELARSASEDLCALLAPSLPQKAFAAMRLRQAGGDIYRPQPNPLHRPAYPADGVPETRRATLPPGATPSHAAADPPLTATETRPAEST